MLPLGLINGDLHLGGTRPAFDADEIIDAVILAAREPNASDDDLLAVVSRPIAPTGCAINGDLAAFCAGELVQLVYASTVSVGPGPQLEVSDLPPRVGAEDVLSAIEDERILDSPFATFPVEGPLNPLVAEVEDESSTRQTRIVVSLRPDADPHHVRSLLLDLDPIAIAVEAQLPAPLPDLIRAAVDVDRTAQLVALERLRTEVQRQREEPDPIRTVRSRGSLSGE